MLRSRGTTNRSPTIASSEPNHEITSHKGGGRSGSLSLLYIAFLLSIGAVLFLLQNRFVNSRSNTAEQPQSTATIHDTSSTSNKDEKTACATEGSQTIPPNLTIDYAKVRSFSNAPLDKLKSFTRENHEKFMLSPPGREHYALLNYLSQNYGDCRHIVDIGTRYVTSALSMGSNLISPVWTFDLPNSSERYKAFRGKQENIWQKELKEIGATIKFHNLNLLEISDEEFRRYMSTWFIMLDTAHRPYSNPFEIQFLQRLIDMNYKGLLLLDDIDESDEMRKWWKEVVEKGMKEAKFKTYDLTGIGHWSGTGLVDFSGRVRIVRDK